MHWREWEVKPQILEHRTGCPEYEIIPSPLHQTTTPRARGKQVLQLSLVPMMTGEGQDKRGCEEKQ